MAQTNIIARGRSGWSPEEQDLLWHEVKKASQNGGSLRTVFDSVANQTGRKPNSIRNYYYIAVKEGQAPEGVSCQRTLPFRPFDDDEMQGLVRRILIARSKGLSVRSCVMEMGEGDKAKTLRYQNKYRSILKNRPDYIKQAMEQLEREGVEFGEDFTPVRRRKYKLSEKAGDADENLMRLRAAIADCGEKAPALVDALCDFLKAQAELSL
ncbi:MAG: hypothetical protein ACOX8S_08825 [Christensenellales bacterium]